MRTQAAWNVLTHILRATGPTRDSMRWRISSAALLVKVMARMAKGLTPSSSIRWAMRWVRTLVLPEPAPATTSRGPSPWTTASSWSGLRPSIKVSAGIRPILRPGRAPVRVGRRRRLVRTTSWYDPIVVRRIVSHPPRRLVLEAFQGRRLRLLTTVLLTGIAGGLVGAAYVGLLHLVQRGLWPTHWDD